MTREIPRTAPRPGSPAPPVRTAPGWVALSGVPGTGKSEVGRLLAPHRPVVEVSDLALVLRAGRRRRREVEIDLARLARRIRALPYWEPRAVLVGHLSHLLPIPDAIVLRCHPRELARRLASGDPGRPRGLPENLQAEATDAVLLEALELGRNVWEVDTTRRTAPEVARSVERIIARRPPVRYGEVDWLADRDVTEHLLPRLRSPGRWWPKGTGRGPPATSTPSSRRSSAGSPIG